MIKNKVLCYNYIFVNKSVLDLLKDIREYFTSVETEKDIEKYLENLVVEYNNEQNQYIGSIYILKH